MKKCQGNSTIKDEIHMITFEHPIRDDRRQEIGIFGEGDDRKLSETVVPTKSEKKDEIVAYIHPTRSEDCIRVECRYQFIQTITHRHVKPVSFHIFIWFCFNYLSEKH